MYFHVYLIYRFTRTFTDHSSVITRCWGFELQNGKSSLKSQQTLAAQDFAPASFLSTPDKKEVTTYVVTSFLDSGRKLKCSGEVNSPSAKVLLRKTLVRRKSADFLDSGRKLKCSGEVNSPSAKVLLRKTLVRRKSVVFCFGRPNRYGTSELGVLFFIRTFPVND